MPGQKVQGGLLPASEESGPPACAALRTAYLCCRERGQGTAGRRALPPRDWVSAWAWGGCPGPADLGHLHATFFPHCRSHLGPRGLLETLYINGCFHLQPLEVFASLA